MRHLPETSAQSRSFSGSAAGAGPEKVSREAYAVAASSLTRWGGTAAVVGGLSTAIVGELLPPFNQPKEDESVISEVRLNVFEYLRTETPPHLREPPS
jgi:hypothetical protein